MCVCVCVCVLVTQLTLYDSWTVQLTLYDPWTVACQALSMGFRQEYWTGQPFPSPGDLLDSGIKPRSLAVQADSLPSEPPEKPQMKQGGGVMSNKMVRAKVPFRSHIRAKTR